MTENTHFLSDSAIKKEEQDLFNFKYYAKKVQRLIQLNSNNSEPFTIGIYGKWGEGKTSFLNLIEEKIDHFDKKEGDKEYYRFHFNPWRYSNEDEMLFDFFDSLSKLFYVEKKDTVGKCIKKYSKYLKAIKISSTVGIPNFLNTKIEFEPNEIFKALGEDLEGEEVTIEKLKEKVNEAIKKANFKVVVFIDDIDRLDKDEIYTILKLIKLNANFNNFIFIVTLDSDHVAKAIKDRYGNEIEDGKLFLEKIINIPIHLPKIENEDLQYFFELKLKETFSSIQFDNQKDKKLEIQEIIKSYNSIHFKSPREIIRVLNGFFIGAFTIGDDVNLKDLFWIEWLKLKNEKLYNRLKNYRHKSVFFEDDRLINFIDDTNAKIAQTLGQNKFKGEYHCTRNIITKESPDFTWFIDEFFPSDKMNVNVEDFENNQNINSSLHYDKYFSFHMNRKTKHTDIQQIERNINKKKNNELAISLVRIFSKDNPTHKSIYILEGIIKQKRTIEDRNYFFQAVFRNISVIPDNRKDMFGINERIRIINLVAKIIKDDNSDNKCISIKLSILLSVNFDYLIRFMLGLKKDNPRLTNVEKVYIKKYKETIKENIPFYVTSDIEELNQSKWFLHLWKNHEPENFNQYIEESITSEERIKKLIRLFPSFLNNSFFGALTRDNYNYLKTLIDVGFLYDKLTEFNPELVSSVNVEDVIISDDYDENTEEENLKQFIRWYKIENDI